MPVKLFLRKNDFQSHFRYWLDRLASSSSGNTLVLCTGYVWEEAGYSVLNDGLLASIKGSPSTEKVIVVCDTRDARWRPRLKRFLLRLEAEGVSIEARQSKSANKWHAKVAVRLNIVDSQIEPIAAIVGSSNLTRPAYAITNVFSWNYECDALIYVPVSVNGNAQEFDITSSELKDRQITGEPMGYLDLVLDPRSSQPSEDDQIRWIFNEIMENTIKFSARDL